MKWRVERSKNQHWNPDHGDGETYPVIVGPSGAAWRVPMSDYGRLTEAVEREAQAIVDAMNSPKCPACGAGLACEHCDGD